MKKTIAVLISVLMMLSVLPAASVDTQADWNMASQIVQDIERPQIPTDYSVNIKDMGAKGDGVSDDLPILQQAIDETSERGGGRVIVPEGTYYLAGPVNLKSYVDLHLEEGSRLLFSPNPEDYPTVHSRWEGTELMNYSAFVYAYEQHDIAITGTGTARTLIRKKQAGSRLVMTGAGLILACGGIFLLTKSLSGYSQFHFDLMGLISFAAGISLAAAGISGKKTRN